MTEGAGGLRSAQSLAETARIVAGLELGALTNRRVRSTLSAHLDPPDAFAGPELQNLLVIARALLAAASAREETRGAHVRTDFPETRSSFSHRFTLRSP